MGCAQRGGGWRGRKHAAPAGVHPLLRPIPPSPGHHCGGTQSSPELRGGEADGAGQHSSPPRSLVAHFGRGGFGARCASYQNPSEMMVIKQRVPQDGLPVLSLHGTSTNIEVTPCFIFNLPPSPIAPETTHFLILSIFH